MIVVMPNGNATQTVSQGYGPTRQVGAAACPASGAGRAANGRGAAGARRRAVRRPVSGEPRQGRIPFVEQRRVQLKTTGRQALMGRRHTLAATNNNPGVFAYIGVFSSGPRTADETFQKQLEAVKAGGVKFYWLGAGTTDMAREGTVTLAELVKKEGFKTSYREIPGRHYWFLWRDFLAQYAQVMFQ
jgi:enterochelin esterase family protein